MQTQYLLAAAQAERRKGYQTLHRERKMKLIIFILWALLLVVIMYRNSWWTATGAEREHVNHINDAIQKWRGNFHSWFFSTIISQGILATLDSELPPGFHHLVFKSYACTAVLNFICMSWSTYYSWIPTRPCYNKEISFLLIFLYSF